MDMYYVCTFSMGNIQWAINPLKIPLDPPSCSVTMKVKCYNIYTAPLIHWKYFDLSHLESTNPAHGW